MFGTNWTATYYNSTDLSGPVVYTELFPKGINVNWGIGAPDYAVRPDNFSARFTSVQLFDAAIYEFVISSDSGVRFYINDTLVLDRFVVRPLTTDRFQLSMASGTHSLRVEYFAAVGQAAIQVQWFAVALIQGESTFFEQLKPRKHDKPLHKSNVFIVHGHDEAMREAVKNYIREIGYTPIVLHERPNLGRTIIEKFEQEAVNVGFALVLLSPDDMGASVANPSEMNPRARQNVILELGYFVGRLGRHRVCLLHKGGINIPSDILGVLYIPFDATDGWKQQLIREMEAAGM